MYNFSNKELFHFVAGLYEPSHTKCRVYRSTKPKIDKEKNKKLRKLSNKSKKINRGNK